MAILDCYDPVVQEERRQAEWDRFVENLPACKLCGKRLLLGDKFHTTGCMRVCPSCVEELNENIETVEDLS